MSFEALWYSHYVLHGGCRPPRRRLSRLPRDVVWLSAIDLAIAVARGEAGWRLGHNAITLEETWWWPSYRPDTRDSSGWWYVPQRIAHRALALVRAATEVETRVPGRSGWCWPEHVTARLGMWRRSGRWRRRISSARGVDGRLHNSPGNRAAAGGRR